MATSKKVITGFIIVNFIILWLAIVLLTLRPTIFTGDESKFFDVVFPIGTKVNFLKGHQ